MLLGTLSGLLTGSWSGLRGVGGQRVPWTCWGYFLDGGKGEVESYSGVLVTDGYLNRGWQLERGGREISDGRDTTEADAEELGSKTE